MALATNTKNTKSKRGNDVENIASSRSGGLILQILAVNVIVPLVLMVGILYMGQYREELIRTELEQLKSQSRLFVAAMADHDFTNEMERSEALAMMNKMASVSQSRLRLFDKATNLIADSREKNRNINNDWEQEYNYTDLDIAMRFVGDKLIDFLPTQTSIKQLPNNEPGLFLSDFPDAKEALKGIVRATAWETSHGEIILTAAAPIKKNGNVQAVILLSQKAYIEPAMAGVRFDVFTVFLGALSVTIFLSIYLAGVVSRPLNKLARAAEAIRLSKNRQTDIPDLSHRKDEIGELSLSLRAMTQDLWDRMDTIEHFAADVSHELKNPLTSLRSAVETVTKVKTDQDRDRLIDIINHDVQRLDRLISDISNASRLDAELSREELVDIDICLLLKNIAEITTQTLKNKNQNKEIILDIPAGKPLIVKGNESRLGRVFDNLLSNALSFTPDNGTVTVTAKIEKYNVVISVRDQGPGIPEKNLETIFERFYTHRPNHEDYGSHSGLGLSIARQIITSHNGRIYAENIEDHGKIVGACFTVKLNKA